MQTFFEAIPWKNIIWSAILIAISFGLWMLIRSFRIRIDAKVDSLFGDNVRKKAAVSSVFNGIKLTIIILCTLNVLQINGVNVSSILAGLGIVGAVAGLAVQDIIKDFIQGLRIMTDNFYTTGDFIRYNNGDYQVIEFSMRTTKLRNLADNDTVTICNRNITDVTQISGTQNVIIGLSYDADPDTADRVLTEAAEEIASLDEFKECRYLGFKDFQNSSTDYLISFTAAPKLLYSARRTAMRVIRRHLDEAGLEIPYNQLDIHQK